MARIRSLKPEFFANDELALLGPLSQLLFAGLWGIADREGRLEDRPLRIKAHVFPYYEADVDELLDGLANSGFVQRYERDGIRVVQVINFTKHQYPNTKEPASQLPPAGEHDADTVPAPYEHDADTEPSHHLTGREGLRAKGEQVGERVGSGEADAADAANDRVSSPHPRSVPKPRPDPPGFAAFWSAYPNHTERKAAVEQWDRLNPDKALQGEIQAAIEAQKRGRKWIEGFIKAPHRWLRDRNWTDEVEPAEPIPINGSRPAGRKPNQSDVFQAIARGEL